MEQIEYREPGISVRGAAGKLILVCDCGIGMKVGLVPGSGVVDRIELQKLVDVFRRKHPCTVAEGGLCFACHRQYRPKRKPRPDRANYCPKCQRDGAARRVTKNAYRAKVRAG